MWNGKKLGVILCAGGTGQRLSAGMPKQFLDLGDGRSILETSLSKFFGEGLEGLCDAAVVTYPAGYEEETRRAAENAAPGLPVHLAPGGAERQDSVQNAADVLSERGFGEDDVVLVHDAARPYVTADLIKNVAQAAFEKQAAVAAVPVKSTIRDREKGTLDRSRLAEVQTPQGFRFGILKEALRQAARDGFTGTDDGSLAERIGVTPALVEGDYANVKITTREDLPEAADDAEQKGNDAMIRIGEGFDVHKLAEGRKLVLCGVEVPYEKGLLGHSDADVALHALMDAMLGALALGDIGHLFPDSDDRYLGISSVTLLKEVAARVRNEGYRVSNLDITIVCQKPKLAPYIDAMRETTAEAAGCGKEQVSVKATTTEGLGFTGTGEGIAAGAVCVLTRE